MRAAVLRADLRVEITQVELPNAPGEVTIRIEATGICGSDLHAVHGEHPFRSPPVILGHEAAGTVVQAPPNCRFAVGELVAIMPSVSCWACRQCEAGRSHLCPHKRVPGKGWPGLLAEYTTAPPRALYPLADGISASEGAMVEPVAVACRAVRASGVRSGDSVAVLGAGAIGSLVASVCQRHGVGTLLVSDVKDYNLEFARGLGVPVVVNAVTNDVVSVGRKATDEDGFDAVIVASGHRSCLDEALALCRPNGVVVVLPLFGAPVPIGLNPLVLREVRVHGSTTYTPADFRTATNLVNSRRLDVRSFVTRFEPLGRAPEVFAAIEDGLDYMKIQFDPSR
jgi:L-iditol 2-dehydrogenase